MQKVSPLVKLEIIPLLLCCLLDPLTNKFSMELYDKIMDRLQELPKKSCYHQGEGLIITIPSQRKCFEEKDPVILTMRYFKVLHDMVPKNS